MDEQTTYDVSGLSKEAMEDEKAFCLEMMSNLEELTAFFKSATESGGVTQEERDRASSALVNLRALARDRVPE